MPTIPQKPILTLDDLVAILKRVYVPGVPADKQSLAERFLLPPFSVLDARQGYWQNRKRAWLALGIQSELGRGIDTTWGITPGGQGTGDNSDALYTENAKTKNGLLGESEQSRSHYKKPNATPGGSPLPAASLKDGKTQRGDGRGRPLATTFGSGKPGDLAAGFKKSDNRAIKDHDCVASRGLEVPQMGKSNRLAPGGTGANTAWLGVGGTDGNEGQSGTSIFDPVLCELAYRWFCPQQGHILDPFAGGSVRGIVASKLGRRYTGIDLRPEQAAANVEQGNLIVPNNLPTWTVGDSINIDTIANGQYDLVFSCPPYFDLEAYSNDPRDLSSMTYPQFLDVYNAIIAKSCAMLKDDRYACFVVGDIRDRSTGNYRGFVSDTIAAFRSAGLELYNDAVLVTSVGSLPIRVGRQFAGYRKLGKTHQNVLVFLKGDAGRATEACGSVDISDMEMPVLNVGAIAVAIGDIADTDMVLDYQPFFDDATGDGIAVLTPPAQISAVVADVLRSNARRAETTCRVWIGKEGGWEPVASDVDLCYLVGDKPYLNAQLFPGCAVPQSSGPRAKALTFGRKLV